MKINILRRISFSVSLIVCLFFINIVSKAQNDTTDATPVAKVHAKVKPVKNTFQSVWLIDNQTVLVPVKGTVEMDIMHRFGVVNNGYKDFWGFFAPSNIRLGVSYSPINKLFVGVGITKSNLLWDANAKYSIITQTKGVYPVSISYYTNVGYDTRKDEDKSIFSHSTDRFSFFNQLLIARKVSEKLSLQVAPSLSHQNAVSGFYTKNDSTGNEVFKNMKNNHFSVALSGRLKVSQSTSLICNYEQPITKHATNNPNPNISFGVELGTSGHCFQLFFTNYYLLSPQRNSLYNTNNPLGYTKDEKGTKVTGSKFLIGFNITRI